jgi:hypothetical protein
MVRNLKQLIGAASCLPQGLPPASPRADALGDSFCSASSPATPGGVARCLESYLS